jgi:hypothetical protein
MISCRLRVVALDKAPTYTALSYVWGSSTNTKEITLDGRPFPVRHNLWNFLQQWQATREGAKDANHFLWIDAICINQDSVSERNHQVPMMREIYSKAAKVVAWLGVGPKSVVNAIKQIRHWDSQHFDGKVLLDVKMELSYLDRLTSSDYWNRLWIIQEYILAKEVELWCGHSTLKAVVIAKLFLALQNFYDPEPPLVARASGSGGSSHGTYFIPAYEAGPRRVRFKVFDQRWPNAGMIMRYRMDKDLPRKFRLRGESSPRGAYELSLSNRFSDISDAFSSAACSDTKDRVYGLLSLVSPEELRKFPITVDYSKTTSQLFADLFDRQCRQEKDSTFRKYCNRDIMHDTERLQRYLGLNDEDKEVIAAKAKVEESRKTA